MPPSSQKIVKGAVVYSLRTVLTLAVGFASNFFLLKFFDPGDFGVLATLIVFNALLAVFSEGGLNVALVQKQQAPPPGTQANFLGFQLSCYVAFQAALSIALGVSHAMRHDSGILLYCWCVLFVMPLNLFRGAAVVNLERNLDIPKISTIELTESITYACVLVALAACGAGVWAMIAACWIKAVVGLALAARFSTLVKPGLPKWNSELAQSLKFGFHFHSTTLLGVVRNAANPILIGSVLGIAAVGIVDRSGFVAGIPATIIGASQSKILFPLFSQNQGDSSKLASIFRRSFYLSNFFDKLLYLPLLLLIGPAMSLFFGSKWDAAIPVIIVMAWGNLLFGSYFSTASSFLNGHGKAHIFGLTGVCSTLVLWILVVPMIKSFGILGVAYISVLNWAPSGVLYYYISKNYSEVPTFSIWLPTTAAAILAFACVHALMHRAGAAPRTFCAIALWTFVAQLAYCIAAFLLSRRLFLDQIGYLLGSVSAKPDIAGNSTMKT